MTPYDFENRECEIMKKILMAMPVGICYAHNRIILWANEFCLKILGYSLDEIIGESSQMFYDSEEEYKRVGKALYTDKSGVVTTIKRKDGTHIRVVVHAISEEVRSEKGFLFPYVITIAPVSETVEKLLNGKCTCE